MIDLQRTLDTTRETPGMFRIALEYNLRRIASERKLQRHFLKAVRLVLEADTAWYVPVPVTAVKPPWDGADRRCDLDAVRAFAAHEEPELPEDLLLAPVKVHGRMTAVVGAGKDDGGFERGTGHDLNQLCALLAAELMRREGRRVNEVLLRIKEEILRELRPRDLTYQILHGLRELVDYDHSSALLIHDRAAGVLRVQAEQIAWTKGKSRAVDRELELSPELAEDLRLRGERIVSRRKGEVDPAAALILEPAGELAEILAYASEGEAPRPTSTLCAPLVDQGELLGLLRVAALQRSPFQRWDARVVSRFLPAAINAIQGAHHRLTKEMQAMTAQRRAYLVNVARVVAHDINNALGAALPLTQQLQAEVESGDIDLDAWHGDLDEVQRYLERCRDIFDRLLRQGDGPRSKNPSTDLNRIVKDCLALLEASLQRHRAEVELELDPELPRVRMHRDHLEHIVWNLVHNALDALPLERGRIEIVTQRGEGQAEEADVELTVSDNGTGIPEEDLERVFLPFHSTKGGTGMGLPLSKKLVEEVGGRIRLRSQAGTGTEVRVQLPAVSSEVAPAEVVP